MTTANRSTIVIGANAGHHFACRGDLRVARHVQRVFADGRVERGFMIRRKWLADRAAFEYDPTMGWAVEHWFEWSST